MFRGLRFVHNTQRGFTLIELLIALVIAGLITGGITAAISQILTINSRASNHMVCVRQVQQAGKEVSKDTLQAQSVNITGTAEALAIKLAWESWGNNETHAVNYTLVNGPGGVMQLQRSYSINGTSPTVTTVGEYIDPTHTSCCCDCNRDGVCDGSCNCTDKVVIFTVTAALGTESETRVYKIQPRPGS